ncbi:MAG: type II toxin-antitoxin system RelE/ParE family toxin [Bacteroidetes bacterium]|jgi:plasmid stabilization system protein ParE|nr:type II toxin-antitoxin system RelE/ParE family toxin [Bacteroidota bacterium]
MTIELFEAALFDLNKSYDYYSDIGAELGETFLRDIERALFEIKENPKASSKHPKYSHLRLKICNRFPFTVIYHPNVKSDTYYIIAVAHHKRNPNYWKERI